MSRQFGQIGEGVQQMGRINVAESEGANAGRVDDPPLLTIVL